MVRAKQQSAFGEVDRILWSNAYARYADKTQVAYLIDHDHISRRALHVQLVSRLGRTLAGRLGLDREIVEAIALGHDVGHPPFGHEGEDYLSRLSEEQGEGPFAHPWQSCRLFTVLEPVGLSLPVLDGMLCHDGGTAESPELLPQSEKGWEQHEEELRRKAANPEIVLRPMTVEGCLVKLCDTVSYIIRDLHDAKVLRILEEEQIPETFFGKSVSTMVERFVEDVAEHSGQERIAMSDALFVAMGELRTFNFSFIYHHPTLKEMSARIQRSYEALFSFLLEHPEFLEKKFLHDKRPEYTESASRARQVIDFISGMTDSYFLRTVKEILVPESVSWSG